MVRAGRSDRSLPPGPSYLIGRDPACDIVVPDARVSWQHAVLRLEDGRWVLADNGSTNGTFVRDRRVDQVEIEGECLVRLGHPADGPVLSCTVSAATPAVPDVVPTEPSPPLREPGPVPSPQDQTVRIGRAPDNDLVVPDPSVSGHHAELRTAPDGCQIVDLGSLNGTFVNEHRVTTATLREGDLVGFGAATFQLVGGNLRE
jgi:pSer/pThr/pTyr-binding forkhead associated (FHA) protein